MHSPQLINEILLLKLKLDLCETVETAEVQAQIAAKMDEVRLISKVPLDRIKALINSRYPDFVKARVQSGLLGIGGSKTVELTRLSQLEGQERYFLPSR
jgi:hypothetical protein